MLRRAATLGLLFALLWASVAAAAPTERPRLQFTKVRVIDEAADLVIASADGSGQRTLLPGRPGLRRGLLPGDTPSWSRDGRLLAFASRRHIWLVGADGGGLRRVPGTRGGYFPVFSPDGRTLAFSRTRRIRKDEEAPPSFASTAVWTVDLKSGEQRRHTALRNGLEQYPESFSPDGSTLLVTRFGAGRSYDYELVAIRFDGRTSSLLAARASYAEFSPDGSRIVFLRNEESGRETFDLYTVDSRGDHLRRLTDTPRFDEFDPGWDPSGKRIVYSLVKTDRQFNIDRASIWQMNPDGTCASELISEPGYLFFAPNFQPDRAGLGPLSC